MNHCDLCTDLALKILEREPSLALARDANGDTALHVLARKPSTIANKRQLGIWKRCINSCKFLEPTQNSQQILCADPWKCWANIFHQGATSYRQIHFISMPLYTLKIHLYIFFFCRHWDHATCLRKFKGIKCSIFQELICVSPEVSRVNLQFQLFSIYIE